MARVRHALTVVAALVLLASLIAVSAAAQDYPSRPIRLIVPFGPGSTADVIARSIGNAIGNELGQPIVIDNRPGAGGTIGAAEAARAPGDGYTLVLGTIASHGVGPLTMHEVPYDPIADFEPITLIADAPSIIVVHHAVPATDLASFIAYVKRNPGIDYASAGTGTTTHLAGEALKLRAGIEMTHVPYKAVGQAVADLLSGQIKMMIYQVPTLKPHVDSGALTLIAATTARRIASLPDLPTVAETYPGFDFSAWFGMLAPAGTPKPIVRKIHAALLEAMESASLKQQFVAQGLEPAGLGPEDFHALMVAALPKWKEIIDLTGTRMP